MLILNIMFSGGFQETCVLACMQVSNNLFILKFKKKPLNGVRFQDGQQDLFSIYQI
jgi:hypothetical protein